MSGNTEAAKYRTRLRDTEAQRDALAATLTGLQRGRVECIAAAHGVTAEALWASGAELDALLGADGDPDPEAVAAAADTAREVLGIPAPAQPRSGTAGLHSGAMRHQPPQDSWTNAFAPPR
ncbi:MAG: hypothetical protein FGM52_05100 [Mycobacterium sp.]|nr:hypothetical protein [Mycobacterium sp.]